MVKCELCLNCKLYSNTLEICMDTIGRTKEMLQHPEYCDYKKEKVKKK